MLFKHRFFSTGVITSCAALLIIAAVLFSLCGNRTVTAVIIAGSTSVQPYAEILAEEYALLHPDQAIDVQGGGSSAGIMAAESGTADIGMSSRLLKENEQGLWFVEIAKDGLAIVVHPKNPVSGVTLEQIRDIYTTAAADWSELRGTKGRIHVIAREEGSGTRSAFEELVMEGNMITPKAIVQDSNGAVKQLVAGDLNAIGFISLGLVDHTVKAVHIDGVAASLENVMDGSYSLYRPFFFVTGKLPDGLSRQFIDFSLSEEGQRILKKEGLVPAMERTKE